MPAVKTDTEGSNAAALARSSNAALLSEVSGEGGGEGGGGGGGEGGGEGGGGGGGGGSLHPGWSLPFSRAVGIELVRNGLQWLHSLCDEGDSFKELISEAMVRSGLLGALVSFRAASDHHLSLTHHMQPNHMGTSTPCTELDDLAFPLLLFPRFKASLLDELLTHYSALAGLASPPGHAHYNAPIDRRGQLEPRQLATSLGPGTDSTSSKRRARRESKAELPVSGLLPFTRKR